MVRRRRSFCSGLAMAVVLSLGAGEAAANTQRIGWVDLLQPGPVEQQIEGTDGAQAGIPLQGQMVELTGYLLPADQEGDLVYSFLLLPEHGGCIHTPSPPPDQIVLIRPSEPFKAESIYQVVSVSGLLGVSREHTQLFVLDGVKVVESGYVIRRASVHSSDETVLAPPASSRNPWQRLRRPNG